MPFFVTVVMKEPSTGDRLLDDTAETEALEVLSEGEDSRVGSVAGVLD